MNWIYKLTLTGTKGTSKEETAKEAMLSGYKKHGSAYLFKDIFAEIRGVPDAQLGFLFILEKYVLSSMIEAKQIDKIFLLGLFNISVNLHGQLIRASSPRKLKYPLKLFNKIFVRLAEAEQTLILKSLKQLIEKKEILGVNWVLHLLGVLTIKKEEEILTLKLSTILNVFFTEKPETNNPANYALFPICFSKVTKDEFKKHYLDAFQYLYKRNSANVGRVFEFIKSFGLSFFKKFSITELQEIIDAKVFEALNNKSEEIAMSGLETVAFFIKLENPELNEFLVKNTATLISGRNIELLKYTTILACLDLHVQKPETSVTVFQLLSNCLEQIKNEDFKNNLIRHFSQDATTFVSKACTLDSIPHLVDLKGSDIGNIVKLILARKIVIKYYQSGVEVDKMNPVFENLFNTTIKKSLIENANRLKASNLEVLLAIELFTTYCSVTGQFSSHMKAISVALSSKDLEYFSDNFFKHSNKAAKLSLFRIISTLDQYIEYPSKLIEIVLAQIVLSPDIELKQLFRGWEPSQKFCVSMIKGLHYLEEWLGRKRNIKVVWEAILPFLFTGTALEAEDASIVIGSLSSLKKAETLVHNFICYMIQTNKLDIVRSALKYPTDMKKPVDHYYLGMNGLFTTVQDKEEFFQNYVAVLIALDQDILFKQCPIFFDNTELSDLKLVHSRNSMIYNRNLDIVETKKESYKELLEFLGLIKKETKKKKAEEIMYEKDRTIPIDYRIAGELELRLVKEEKTYSDYKNHLTKLSHSISIATKSILNSESEEANRFKENLRTSGLFNKLRGIATNFELLRDAVKEMLCSILFGLLLKLSNKEFCERFSHLYFEVVSDLRRNQVMKQLEESLLFLYNVRNDENLHPAAIPIILDFSQFCFENMYDGEARRRSYDIIIRYFEL